MRAPKHTSRNSSGNSCGNTTERRLQALCAVSALALVVACAPFRAPPRADSPHPNPGANSAANSAANSEANAAESELHWSGRLQVDVKTTPAVHIASDFELDTRLDEGELRVLGPLGATLAVITWAGAELPATIESAQLKPRVQSFDSLDALMAQWLGTPVPSHTLLAWLQGQAVEMPGWRFSKPTPEIFWAQRVEPLPVVDFKITRSPTP